MTENKHFKALQKEFESTFGELIQGVLHNFASPLNGILGRSELLKNRAIQNELLINKVKNLDEKILEIGKKISKDAGLIEKEADRFFGLFNDVAEKFQMLSQTDLQQINLSELVEEEIAFLKFYPDFKYIIENSLILDRNIPEVAGMKAEYSMSLSAIIRHVLNVTKDSDVKRFTITTGHDDSCAFIKIESSGPPIEGMKKAKDNLSSKCEFHHDLDGKKGLFNALSLLKKYGAFFQMTYESDFNIILIKIPFNKSE